MADTNYQRAIALDDALLLTLVKQKGELVEKGRVIAKQQEELAKQHDKLSKELSALTGRVNDLKLDIIRRTYKRAKTLLSEYEIPITTEVREGKLVLVVSDSLAEFTDNFKRFDKWKEPSPRKAK